MTLPSCRVAIAKSLAWQRKVTRRRFRAAQTSDAMFTFLRRRDVEATNFRAEQGIRPAVVNRKVWGGNRTRPGAHAQEVLMSVMQTCHQRRADVVGFLADVQHAPRALPPVVTLGWENLPIPAGASP